MYLLNGSKLNRSDRRAELSRSFSNNYVWREWNLQQRTVGPVITNSVQGTINAFTVSSAHEPGRLEK